MRLLLLSLSFCHLFRTSVSSSQYMRRHTTRRSDHHSGSRTRIHRAAPVGKPAAASSPEHFLVAGVASSGAITGEKMRKKVENQALIEESYRQLRQQFFTARKLLAEAGKRDIYDKDGFEVWQVSKEQRLAEHQEEVDEDNKRLAQTRKNEEDYSKKYNKLLKEGNMGALIEHSDRSTAAHTLVTTDYSGMDAPRTGFWAKDRPNEERIDPNNMKIYTWRTYRLRFPYQHTWETESAWKMLPLAPKKIQKVKKAKLSSSSGAQLLEQESGSMLVDENSQELVWTRNHQGYYFQGHSLPSEMDQLRKSKPRLWQSLQQKSEEEVPLYPDYDEQIQAFSRDLNASHAMRRYAAFHQLSGVLAEMEDKMNLSQRSYGKAFISVFGAEGNVENFNADIAKVNVKAIKRRIQNHTGIPWESQRIFANKKELLDSALLNTVVGGGRTLRLSLHVRNDAVMQDAGLISHAANARTKNRITEVLLEKQRRSPDDQEQVSSRSSDAEENPTRKKKRHAKGKHHPHSKRKSHDLETMENAARKAATKELVNIDIGDDTALKADEDSNNADGQSDDADASWDFWGATGAGSSQPEPTKEEQEASYQATAQAVVESEAKARAAKEEQLAEVTTTAEPPEPPQHTKLLGRVVYVKDPSGNWVVEKADAGGNGEIGDAPDYGIPVEQRMQENSEDDTEEHSSSSIAAPNPAFAEALVQEGSPPETMEEERKRVKHALSEETRYRMGLEHKSGTNVSGKAVTTTMAPTGKKVSGSLADIAAHSSW